MFFSCCFDISRGYVQAEKSVPFCAACFCFEDLKEQEKKKTKTQQRKCVLRWSLKQLLYPIIPLSFPEQI